MNKKKQTECILEKMVDILVKKAYDFPKLFISEPQNPVAIIYVFTT
jgi:hypothetical protein